MCLRCVVSSLSVVGYIKGGWRWSRSKGVVMNSFYLTRNSEGAKRDHQFIAEWNGYFFNSQTLYFLGTQMNYETLL